MNTFGKSIRIYLKDGSVTGIKFGEVVNQTIQSISCPRLRLSDLSNNLESNRPGVYFLFGFDENSGEPKVYIGEAENVYTRLQSHASNKDFWNEVIFFVSKDENLTKSHVRYLESRLIQLTIAAKRYNIDNINQSSLSQLPAADKDAMEEFLSYIKLLIGVLGHKVLEDIIISNTTSSITSYQVDKNLYTQIDSEVNNEFYISISGLYAKAIQTNEGLVVLNNSECALKISNSLPHSYRELRDKLIKEETLRKDNEKYIFKNDVLFNSPSQAAAIIVGYSVNGLIAWKNSSGKSMKETEKEKLSAFTSTE